MNGLYEVGQGPDPGPARRVASAERMRELEAKAEEEHGVSRVLLMENAARASADAIERLRQERGIEGNVVVLAGPGNNGGDGIAVARTLRARGIPVSLWRVVGPGHEHDPSAAHTVHRAMWDKAGGKLRTLDGGAGELGRFADEFAALESEIAKADLVIDALFGTGLSRPLGEPFSTVLATAAGSGKPIVALDVPSGVDADTGDPLGAPARAVMTVTFGALKPGLVRGLGVELAGRVLAAEIGLPPSLLADLEPLTRAT